MLITSLARLRRRSRSRSLDRRSTSLFSSRPGAPGAGEGGRRRRSRSPLDGRRTRPTHRSRSRSRSMSLRRGEERRNESPLRGRLTQPANKSRSRSRSLHREDESCRGRISERWGRGRSRSRSRSRSAAAGEACSAGKGADEDLLQALVSHRNGLKLAEERTRELEADAGGWGEPPPDLRHSAEVIEVGFICSHNAYARTC